MFTILFCTSDCNIGKNLFVCSIKVLPSFPINKILYNEDSKFFFSFQYVKELSRHPRSSSTSSPALTGELTPDRPSSLSSPATTGDLLLGLFSLSAP